LSKERLQFFQLLFQFQGLYSEGFKLFIEFSYLNFIENHFVLVFLESGWVLLNERLIFGLFLEFGTKFKLKV